jgi:hypothetical protein
MNFNIDPKVLWEFDGLGKFAPIIRERNKHGAKETLHSNDQRTKTQDIQQYENHTARLDSGFLRDCNSIVYRLSIDLDLGDCDGYSTTEMLFRVYSRFVPNLTRQDGSAFKRMLLQASLQLLERRHHD